MEFFLPSVLILLLAAAVVFFVLPKFGPFVLAVVSAALLALGIWQHRSMFGPEYRYSTTFSGLMAYAPYVMIGGLLFVIAIYLLYLLPANTNTGSTAASSLIPNIPSVIGMPTADSATNPVTSAINKGINSVANTVSAITGNNKKNNGIFSALTNKKNNNKGLSIPFSQI